MDKHLPCSINSASLTGTPAQQLLLLKNCGRSVQHAASTYCGAPLHRRYPGHAAQQYFQQLGQDLVQQAGTAASPGVAQTPQVPPGLPPELPNPAAGSRSRGKRKLSSPNGVSKRQRRSPDRVHQAAATQQPGRTVSAADSLPDSPCTIPGAADWAAVISVRVSLQRNVQPLLLHYP